MELLPGNSGAQPITTNVTIHYDPRASNAIAGLGTLNALGESFAERYNSHSGVFVLLAISGIIQINMSGIYEFHHDVALQDDIQVGRMSFVTQWRRQRIGETGFTEVPGTNAHMTLRGISASDRAACSVKFVTDDVQAGDLYWPVVLGQPTDPPVFGPQTVADGCRITVEKMS